MRSVLVGEVRTGRRITQIPVASASWSMVHRGSGAISVTIPLNASDFKILERSYFGGLYPSVSLWPSPTTYPLDATPVWRAGQGMRPEFLSAIEGGRCFLAVLEDDAVLQWGPIWTWSFDYATGMLTVTAGDTRSLFDHRFVLGILTDPRTAPAWAVTYSALSLGTIAKRLVQNAQAATGGALPIVFPADETGVDTRTYRGFELATVLSRLDQLSGVINGPDISFEPRLTADRLGIEVVMRTGTVAQPLLFQAGDDVIWDARVPQGGVSGMSIVRDWSRLAQRSWSTGSGADEALLMDAATDTTLLDAGFPLMEVTDAHTTVTDPVTVQAWASGNLGAVARPWQTWKFTVRSDLAPKLGSYRTGEWAKIFTPTDHPLLSLLSAKSMYRARILRISGDLTEQVSIEAAPTTESR